MMAVRIRFLPPFMTTRVRGEGDIAHLEPPVPNVRSNNRNIKAILPPRLSDGRTISVL